METGEECTISEAECPLFPSPSERHLFSTVAWHGIGCSLVSIMGSLLIISSYFLFALYKFSPFRVILFLTFADLLYSICRLIMWDNQMNLFDEARCYTQAFLETWATFSQLGWTMVIAIMIFSENIQKKIPAEIFSTPRWVLYLILGFVVPTVLAIPGLFFVYSPDQYWCWIKIPGSKIVCNPLFHKHYDDTCDSASMTLIILFLVLTWGVIITNTTLYFLIICYRQREDLLRSSSLSQRDLRRSSINLLAFPIVQVIIWLFPTINRVYSLTTHQQGYPWLVIFQVSLMSLQGAVNSVIYGLNPLVRYKLKNLVKYGRVRSMTQEEFEPFIDTSESERNL